MLCVFKTQTAERVSELLLLLLLVGLKIHIKSAGRSIKFMCAYTPSNVHTKGCYILYILSTHYMYIYIYIGETGAKWNTG
jgi:hypothetical protein